MANKTTKKTVKTKYKPKKRRKSKSKLQKSLKKLKKNKKAMALIIIAVILAIVGVVALFVNHSNDTRVKEIDKDVAYGVDVSAHNGQIDWKTVSDNVDFAFIRVAYRGYTDGGVYTDEKASYNLSEANKYGVPVGVYVYSQATNPQEAIEEAQYAIDIAKAYKISLPIVIDFEYAANDDGEIAGRLYDANLTDDEAAELVNAFGRTVSEAGYIPAVYASSNIYISHMNMDMLNPEIKIWVADYNKSVTYKGNYEFWQYSKGGSCPGIGSKFVDTNYWYIKK